MTTTRIGRGLKLAMMSLAIALAACAVAAQGAAAKPRNSAACVPGGDPADPEKTVDALRFSSATLAQFDDVFRCLGQGETPMPGWDVAAKGYVRLLPDAGPVDQILMQALLNVWQGKHWYTNADGGYLYNRMFDDRQTWYHRVSYTPTSLVDDKPAIFVDASPVPGVDNIRMVQPGVYLGITMTDGLHPIFGPDSSVTLPRGLAHGYFILDFNNPEVTPAECPICTPTDNKGP
ncbi:MAG TPA: hypothetical protein VHU24_03005 [Solirubrobacterales bacterium]|nr:hypothetical protein [Solirubrobacterales bacterium]